MMNRIPVIMNHPITALIKPKIIAIKSNRKNALWRRGTKYVTALIDPKINAGNVTTPSPVP